MKDGRSCPGRGDGGPGIYVCSVLVSAEMLVNETIISAVSSRSDVQTFGEFYM